MSRIYVKFGHVRYSDQQIAESIGAIFDSRTTLAMATTLEGHSHINTAHFAYNSSLEIFIFSPPAARHSRNLDINRSVSIAMWIEQDAFPAALRSVQLFGTCERVAKTQLADAITLYGQRFPSFVKLVQHPTDFARGVTDSRFFVAKIRTVVLIDELSFGTQDRLELWPRNVR